MSKTTPMSIRIDKDTKAKAANIFEDLGLNTSQAISIFLRKVIHVGGIPFDVKIPNRETIATFKNTDAGKDLHRVSNIDELAQELKA